MILPHKIPKINILIDDGGHSMKQQIVSFEELFSHVKEDGVYLCEDCHTSYWWNYGGGYNRKNTFIEYSKKWIDYINAYHSKSQRLKVSDFTKTVKSIHYYDSVVVLEKGKIEKPLATRTGTPTLIIEKEKFKGIKLIKHLLTAGTNKCFSILNLPFHIE